ncbi:MFS transporter [Gluconobacter cerinus]|uniref:MFS transporter n=1 Tax=Gluconobacter cerinus TaxID=38307 RepID=UPI001B8B8C4D|nr:MFS transporter [Gluconobacter cerinus]
MSATELSPPHRSAVTKSRILWGMPVMLLWGYIAVALYMTGDGIEVAFLAKYVTQIGFTPKQAGMLFTIYGATAAISSWLSGVLAEVYGARRIMAIGTIWWALCHVAFLGLGLGQHSFPMMMLFYGLRGFAYPLFFYAFFFWIVQKTPDHRLASAIGWVWSMFTLGYGIIASFLPSWTIPAFGFMPTLWMSLAWVLAGGALACLTIREDPSEAQPLAAKVSVKEQLIEISRSLTLIVENRDIALALITRVICNLSLFGFPVIMPLFYTSPEVGFTMPQWLRIYGAFFLVQPVTNVVWGLIGDRIGWLRQMRWFGFVGCAMASLAFYFIPHLMPGNMFTAIIGALFLALTLNAFVPMGAIFPAIAPDHKGAAVSVQNLGGGLSNFLGPALATLFVTGYGTRGVVYIYAALYLLAAVITCFIRLQQPKGASAMEVYSSAKASAVHEEMEDLGIQTQKS